MGLIQTTRKDLEQLLALSGFCDVLWSECGCESKQTDDRGAKNFNAF